MNAKHMDVKLNVIAYRLTTFQHCKIPWQYPWTYSKLPSLLFQVYFSQNSLTSSIFSMTSCHSKLKTMWPKQLDGPITKKQLNHRII